MPVYPGALRFAAPTVSPISFRMAAKFDDSRFVGMQPLPTLRQLLAQFRQKPLCFVTMFEALFATKDRCGKPTGPRP